MAKAKKAQATSAAVVKTRNSFNQNNANEITTLKLFGFSVTFLSDCSIKISNKSETVIFKYKNYDNAENFRITITPLYGLLRAQRDYINKAGEDFELNNYVIDKMASTNSRLLVNQEIFGKRYFEVISKREIDDWRALYLYLNIAFHSGDLVKCFLENEVEEVAPEHYRLIDNNQKAQFLCRVYIDENREDVLRFHATILLLSASMAVDHKNKGFGAPWRMMEDSFNVSRQEFLTYQALHGTDGLTTLRGVYLKNLPQNKIEIAEIDIPSSVFE